MTHKIDSSPNFLWFCRQGYLDSYWSYKLLHKLWFPEEIAIQIDALIDRWTEWRVLRQCNGGVLRTWPTKVHMQSVIVDPLQWDCRLFIDVQHVTATHRLSPGPGTHPYSRLHSIIIMDVLKKPGSFSVGGWSTKTPRHTQTLPSPRHPQLFSVTSFTLDDKFNNNWNWSREKATYIHM